MLHLALAALLAGTPSNPATDRPADPVADRPAATEAPIGIVRKAAEEAPINDTYAFGRQEVTPLKFWVAYAWGRSDERYNAAGDQVGLGPTAAPNAIERITVQRAFVGAQADFLNLERFRVGVGAQLALASDDLTAGSPAPPGITDQSTGFGLQNLKLFAHARGEVLGLHAGYILDLGADPADGDPTFTSVSDRRDAIFVGASFDYPSERFRLFAGLDYFMTQENADLGPAGTETADLIVFNAGAGVRFAWVELGAAAILHASLGPAVAGGQGQPSLTGAGHQGSIAPYLRLSPPGLPVSLSVRGAVNTEYADYGYSIGGARKPVTQQGFTVAATFGF